MVDKAEETYSDEVKCDSSVLDIMLSYSKEDQDFVNKLVESLERTLYRVWCYGREHSRYSDGGQGQAVIDCKVIIQVLSQDSAKSQACQNELALAYVSNTPVFPVGRQYFPKIAPLMTSSMKLILAKINWTFFVEEEAYESNLSQLLTSISPHFHGMGTDTLNEQGNSDVSTDEAPMVKDFWDRHFALTKEISWTEFRDTFLSDYEELLREKFEDDQAKRWVVSLIYRDIFDMNKKIDRYTYDKFAGECKSIGHDHFFNRVVDYAIGSFAMKEVFNMESSVRLTAVQNLGSFHTPAVRQVLLGFLEDNDPNMRAVAALALGRTGTKNTKVIEKLVKRCSDEDRLVRQSSCLSLGKLKMTKQIPFILEMWRNDPIHDVRESALIALDLMGGEEAKEAIKVTKVLSTEMQHLRQQSTL